MKSNYQNHIILKIRKLRESKGYSQKKLATFLGISEGQMGNIESIIPPHKYTLSQIHRICKLFEVPIQQIFIEEFNDDMRDVIELLISNIIKYEER